MERQCLEIDGVVEIAHDLHCKSEEALHKLLDYLSDDYNIKNCNEDPDYPSDSYFASLSERVFKRYVKCNYCGAYTGMAGCRVHGFSCSACSRVLWREYIPTAQVKFSFRDDPKRLYITLSCAGYKDDHLLLNPEPIAKNGYFDVKQGDVPAYLEQFKDSYTIVEIDGVKLLSFYLPVSKYYNDGEHQNQIKISIADVWPPLNGEPRCHYKEIVLFKDQEYAGSLTGGNLPIKESWSIYPTYKSVLKNKKMAQSIILAAGQVPDCGYYYQDGRVAFHSTAINWIETYIEHFTDLSVDDFRMFAAKCRKDGPGFIIDFSHWVEKATGVTQEVINEPNWCNAISALDKSAKGERLTPREVVAAERAMQDEKTKKILEKILFQ